MEKNNDYFDNKSEAEKLKNVAALVNDIVNAKPEEPAEVVETTEVDPIVDFLSYLQHRTSIVDKQENRHS